MKKIKITEQQYGRFYKRFLRPGDFEHLLGHLVVDSTGVSYEWKQQKNGLIKYKISPLSDRLLTIEAIKKEIDKKNQIILMEGKTYFVVMDAPQDVSEVV